MMLWILLSVVLIVLAYLLIKFCYEVIIINKIPGPTAYPIIGNLLDINVSTDKLWNLLRSLAKKHYPVYRLWSGPYCVVAFLDPDDVEVVLSSSKHITKSLLYSLLEPWLGEGLLTSTGNKWLNRRKILTPAFHFNILQQFVPIFVEQSELLIRKLNVERKKDQFDVVPVITKFTLFSICETAMGIRLNDDFGQYKFYANAVYRIGKLVVNRVLSPWYYSDLTYLFSNDFWEKKKLIKYLHKFSNSVIQERKSFNLHSTDNTEINVEENIYFKAKKRLAMLDVLITAQINGDSIDDEGIREEVDTFMFEGHDTTATCICFTLLLLANNEDVQEKLLEEIESTLENSESSFTYQNLQQLNYLDRVIKESLRMFPSVPLIARKLDETVVTKSNYVVPKSVYVHVYIYDLHHNPKVFPNPEKFDPDRFLPENCVGRHPFAYLPFSAGPRNCIGQKFAMLEIKTALANIVKNFRLVPIDKVSDIVLVTDLLTRPRDGIRIKFEHREGRL